MSLAKLNISIRWKMLAGFLLSAIIPCALFWNEVPLLWVFIISMISSLFLAMIGVLRVMHVLKKVQDKIGGSSLKNERDELRLIDESLHHFSEYFNQAQNDMALANVQTTGFDQFTLEKSYKARLATGEPVAGDIYVLAESGNQELITSARLVGGHAKEVFHSAVENVIRDLNKLKDMVSLSESDKGIIDFQVIILHDPSLIQEVEVSLNSGENLLATISRTFDTLVQKLKGSDNLYMKGRIYDFDDLKKRLFEAIHNTYEQGGADRFAGCRDKIVACEHILPSEVINLYNAGAKGIISRENTASSHAQILLSSLNLSSTTGVGELPINKLNGHRALLNTMKGQLRIDPTDQQTTSAIEEFNSRKADIIEDEVCLISGEAINIGVTVNNPRIEAVHAKEMCPDFVGLFRTEMHFIGQASLPLEEELVEEYSNLTRNFKDKLIVYRMLDLGGDKICGYHSKASTEENPCMGQRSMRFLLDNPELFTLQLRAILKSIAKKGCLLFPMISGWSELHKIESFVEKTIKELKDEGVDIEPPLKGIMVEVPSIVARFEDYVDHFDVFNIGTNDLTQYALAADRNNDAVSQYYKPYHPSVLAMIAKVARLCKEKGKKAIICGQMGADIELLPLLIGLGIENISVNWTSVSKLKKSVTELNFEECRLLAEKAILCKSVEEVEELLNY